MTVTFPPNRRESVTASEPASLQGQQDQYNRDNPDLERPLRRAISDMISGKMKPVTEPTDHLPMPSEKVQSKRPKK